MRLSLRLPLLLALGLVRPAVAAAPSLVLGATDGYLRDGKISGNVHLPLRRP